MLGTRPNIAFVVIKLLRYTSNSNKVYFTTVYWVLKYLKATINYKITYSKELNKYITGYYNTDYTGNLFTVKSTSGYIFILAGGPISWKFKLQSIIAQSTTEAKYIVINATVKEAVFIISLLKELGFYNQTKFPIYTDNNRALLLAKNLIFHERIKYIAVKYHYIRDLINKGIINLIYISTNDQKADG
jgi:hypothetical protein